MKKTQQTLTNLIQPITRYRRFLFIGLILVAGLALYAAPWRRAQNTQAVAAFATITVTGTADGTLASLAGNGTCDLREAIQAANTNAAVGECTAGAAGLDTINFNLPGPSYTINVALGGLQTITQPVVIDGAPFAGSPDRVELNGTSAGGGVNGLFITAGGSTIRKLVINRFNRAGIELNGSSGNVIEGCFIGTDAAGTADLGNGQYGVSIVASANNTIGGATADKRNVISGNNAYGVICGSDTTIQGNYIGTDKNGEAAIPNNGSGILFGGVTNVTIRDNVVSGNGDHGIFANSFTSGLVIRGNLIGTDKDGEAKLGNTGVGVALGFGGTNNVIGGTTPADRNVISGNNGDGLATGSGATVQGNYIGTNAAGTAALGNSRRGILAGSNCIIGGMTGTTPGGPCTGPCNLISGNGNEGIVVGNSSGVQTSPTNSFVQGNFIGTDVTGSVDLGNALSGVHLNAGTTVGGTTDTARNVISGNNGNGIFLDGSRGGNSSVVQGNYIGLNAAGTSDLGNAQTGIVVSSANNLIGGTAAGAGNVISGNDLDGICACATLFAPDTNTIQGNLIGTDATGTLDRGTTRDGIFANGQFTIIGGTTAAARNIISGNNGSGISYIPSGLGATALITIQGNYIGTDFTGTLPLGNTSTGIYIAGGGSSPIGGTAAGMGNVIAANGGHGIALRGGTTTAPTIQGNYIGTDKNGLTGSGLGNNLNGIKLGDAGSGATGVTIGGATAAARNVIAGNSQNGIELTTSSTNTSIKGNYIGQNTLNGVLATQVNGVNANTIGGTAAGEGNTITGNGENGVQVRNTINVAIRGNAIYDNAKLGIDLAPTLPGGTVTPNDAGDGDGGPNLLQNFPVLDPITQPCTVTGSLDSTTISPANPVRIEFFANTACDTAGNGEGEVYLDFVVLTAPGSFSRSFTPVPGKPVITATATDNNGNTSEFSACRTAPVNQAPVITPAGVTRVEGQLGANTTIANITDANQASNTLSITINGQPISPSPTVTVNGVTISNLAITPAGALTADVVAACGATNASFMLAATDNCGVTITGSLTVTVTPAPAPMASAGLDQALCSTGATTTFTLAGSAANGAAAWSVVSGPVSVTNPGALNSTAVFTGVGTATLQLTVTGSCGTATDEVVLTVYPPPDAEAGPDRTLTCATTSVTLNGSSTSPGATFSWSGPGGFSSNVAAPVVSVAGVYTLTVTSAAGCIATDTVTVTSDVAAPNAEAGADKTLTCSTTSVTLNGSSTTPGATFSWSGPGGFTSTAAAPVVNVAGIYTLTVTNPANGCTASDSVTVTANTTPPDATITAPNEVCANATGIVASVPDAGPGAAYVWTLTNGTVTSGQGSHAITFAAGASGSVSITAAVQGGNDCSTSSSKTVTIKPATAITVPPSNQAVCAGSSAPVAFAVTAAGVNLSYAWTLDGNAVGSNAANITIDPSSLPVGTYTVSVTVTGECGAPVTTTATLTVNANPSAVITAPATVCPNSTGNSASVLDAGAGASYAWTITNGTITAGAGTQQITWTAGASGTATLNVTVTTANGCSTSSSKPVAIDAAFTPTITGPAEICAGAPATLDAGVGYSGYAWSNGATTQTITVSPNATTTYSVTVTNAAGCSASATKTVTVNPRPVVTVNSPAICAGASPATMTATVTGGTGPFSYLWSGPGGFTASTQSINVSTAGVYTVNVTDAKGCAAASASGTLTANPTPSATITAPAAVCANSTGNAASVADAGAGASYNWTITGGAITAGQNTPSVTWSAGASGTATLNVTVTNAAGCSATAPPKTVTINQPPSITPLTSVTVNAGSAASFTTTASGAGPFSFVWRKGATVLASGGAITIISTATTSALNIASATAADAGNYSVEVSGACGPAATSDSAVLTVNQASAGCVYSHGYWKNHAAQWPVSTLTLGSQTYTKTELLALLGAAAKGDASIILAHQHIAAKLNIANGASATVVAATVQTADNWLSQFSGKLPYGVKSSSSQGQVAVNLADTLDRYNNGALAGGPPHCDSGVLSPATASTRAVRNDFDGDGKSDLVNWRDADGRWLITHSSDSGGDQQWLGEKGDVPIPADYDGDGRYDLAVWRPVDGRWLIRLSQNDATIDRQWGAQGDSPAPADYDGDGQADLAVWRGSEGVWQILRSSDDHVETVSWGLASAPYYDVPVAEDYDGDGKADIAVFRRANGRWYIKQSSDSQSSDGAVVERQWGMATDTPVPADYDGDGKADLAVWRGTEGRWYIARSSDQTAQVIALELISSGDVPAPGDYDGDGQAEAAIWRPGEGRWQVKRSRDGQTMSKTLAEWGTNPTRPSSPERR